MKGPSFMGVLFWLVLLWQWVRGGGAWHIICERGNVSQN